MVSQGKVGGRFGDLQVVTQLPDDIVDGEGGIYPRSDGDTIQGEDIVRRDERRARSVRRGRRHVNCDQVRTVMRRRQEVRIVCLF